MTIYPIGTKNDDETRNIINNNFGFLRENSNELLRRIADVKKYIDNKGEEILSESVVKEWLSENEFKPKPAVNSLSDLPQNAELKEIRLVVEENKQYIYDGSKWIEFGQINANGLDTVKKDIGLSIEDFPRLSLELTDSMRIQRMIDAAPETGAVLVFNDEEYIIGDRTVNVTKNNLIFIGKGANTIFKMIDNVNLSKNGAFYATDKNDIEFRNITFDGNMLNQVNTYHILRLEKISNPSLDNVRFRNVYGTCLVLTGSSNIYINRLMFYNIEGKELNPGECIYGQNIKGGSFNNVFAQDIGDHLFYVGGGDDGLDYMSNINFINCVGVNCGKNGITNGAAFNIVNDCDNLSFVNCHSLDSRSGFYFHENGTSKKAPRNYTLTNCTAKGSNFSAGFYLAGLTSEVTKVNANAKLIGCISSNNLGAGAPCGFKVENIDGFTATDCYAEGNGLNGFSLVNVSNFKIIIAKVLNNGKTAATQGVRIDGNCQKGEIRNVTSKGHSPQDLAILDGAKDINVYSVDADIVYMPEKSGEYSIDNNVVALNVTGNTGDGVVTLIKGAKYVESVVSNATGFRINLKGLPSVVKPFVQTQTSTINQFKHTVGSTVTYSYTRSYSNAYVDIGLKIQENSGSHTPLNAIVSGGLGVIITL